MNLARIYSLIAFLSAGDSSTKALDEMELSPAAPTNTLDCEPQQHYTEGIAVQQVRRRVGVLVSYANKVDVITMCTAVSIEDIQFT